MTLTNLGEWTLGWSALPGGKRPPSGRSMAWSGVERSVPQINRADTAGSTNTPSIVFPAHFRGSCVTAKLPLGMYPTGPVFKQGVPPCT